MESVTINKMQGHSMNSPELRWKNIEVCCAHDESPVSIKYGEFFE
jgi:hypothetical protein